jgi:hypothetical protein
MSALSYFERSGCQGCFTEGGIIHVVLYAMCLHAMLRAGEATWGKRSPAIQSFMYAGIMCMNFLLETDPDLEHKMLEEMQTSTVNLVLRNYDIIKSWQRSETWFPYSYIGMTRDQIRHAYTAIGRDALINVAKTLFSDPYAFIKGWPDLAIFSGANLYLVEVKTNDRLHPSQLITMPAMRLAGLPIEVLRIRQT